ncbi:glycosyltransferase family 1 protein [Rubrobacter taiwanensis]|uniref:Glycosyltransferase family 1 protein n=1 Tax=Rubrobacter taiwanensis TaxID=185139 RepID=A0A4R1BU16_9ACTN|nr:glycosyltransferase family 1 protein [Rubrobacter taiwanensis]TCJ20785.1 glycosyltransferase family 1 protein [Rubrobacter taiwanensis]
MAERLRVAVTGLAATYPYGGVFWDYMQYPLGLRRLGHDVLYVEDPEIWCYDPVTHTFVEHGGRHADLLARRIAALDPDLKDRWFFRDATGRTYGREWGEVVRFCRGADLFLHLSASCWMREEYFAARTVAFVDSDPMYTQASVPDYLAGTADELDRARIEMLRRHDAFFTFGENVGAPDCRIPAALFDWTPTRQPVVLDLFRDARIPVAGRRPVLTTVASWEPSKRELVVDGVAYGGKSLELERFLDLPARSALPLELALSGEAPVERLRERGWRLTDPGAVSCDPGVYRSYLASSLGEWSVAKNAYVESRSGWFSCRTACYLALGVPAVVQDTGFPIPTGEGLFAFATPDEAAAAIEELASDPERHAAAAVELAAEYFGSDRVLNELIEAALRNSG